MTDTRSEYDNATEEVRQLSDEVVTDKKAGKDAEIGLPANRVIRKRIAARTTGVHLSALPPELQALKKATDNAYLTKYDLPDEIHLTLSNGDRKVLSREEAWAFADEAGSKLESDITPDTLASKAIALFSSTGQGVYANYGRPSIDFAGFFHDTMASQGRNNIMLGPILIAVDTVNAAGLTALGHVTRSAPLTDKAVLSDVVSTGVFEGSTSWASAKLGVLTGAKLMRLTAVLPIPGAHLAAVPIGLLVGISTAIFAKHFTNQYKDRAIDLAHQSIMQSSASETARDAIPA